MAETMVKVAMSPFMTMALKSVESVSEELESKGTSIRFSSDYCNQVIAVLQKNPEFAKHSYAELKLCLKAFFEAVVLNAVASELKIIKE